MSRFWHPTPELQPLIQELRQQQEVLRAQLDLSRSPEEIKTIAGCDSAIIGEDIFSVFVIFSYPDLLELEVQVHQSATPFPYIPGFLAFREVPNLLLAYQKLSHLPDLIMVDGHGIMHPRRMGIAAHLGVTLNIPTIGVAKKRLFGKYAAVGEEKGAYSYMYDKDEVLGIVLRSKEKVNPIFVSAGHLCTLETAHQVVLTTLHGYKLPEPTRIADKYSKELKTFQPTLFSVPSTS